MSLTFFCARLGCVFAILATGVAGCSSVDSSSSLGAKPGGAQDDALANEKIERGIVPNEEDITVEGMLASHDLPLAGPSCMQPLCIQSAYAVAPTLDYQQSAVFVQMGLSSGIDEAAFKRAPLNLSVVVDRSGSMAGEKITAVRAALSKLVNQLDPDDRLSIVLFDDRVDVLLPSASVGDKAAIIALISNIHERGATNMSIGLGEGFSQVRKFSGVTGVSDRVIVFTDAMVNTGSTDTESFIGQASSAAQQGIGLTVFGVGIDLNQELVLAISNLRGGNYAFLSDAARIATVFDKDFDYLVTPLAYDLRFTLSPANGFTVKSVYGFPAWATSASAIEIKIATVFLSRGHGAIVARLERNGVWPSGSTPLASLALTYQPANATEGHSEAAQTLYDGEIPLGDDTRFYSQLGVRRTVGYVNAALGMKSACKLYWQGRLSEAVTRLDATYTLLTDEAAATEDAGLDTEAIRVTLLRSNMQSGGYGDNYAYGDEGNDVVGPLACSMSPTDGSQGRGRVWWLAAILIGLALLRRTTSLSVANRPGKV